MTGISNLEPPDCDKTSKKPFQAGEPGTILCSGLSLP